MERKEALQKALNYLKSTGENNWKQGDELKRRTKQMGFMSTAHAIADIYQRGQSPRDIDLQRIDFSLSQPEVRKQIDELLSKRGADDFETSKQDKVKSGIEELEALREEEEERLEKARKQISEEIDEMMPEGAQEGRLYRARDNAWTGYVLGIRNSSSGLKSLQRAIEYANAILDIDEDLEEDFEGDFRDLKQKKEELQELIRQIEDTNFEASELDQSEIPEDEKIQEKKTELTQDRVHAEIKQIGDGDAVEEEFLIESLQEDYKTNRDEIEAYIERLKVNGTAYEPRPGALKLLDTQVTFEEEEDEDEQQTLQDEQTSFESVEFDGNKQVETETYGNVTVKLVKEDPDNLRVVESLNDARSYLRDKIGTEADEHMLAIFLDAGNNVLGDYTIAKGNVDSVGFSERAIARAGILMNARAVIIAHNHPSGEADSTDQDVQATRRLEEALIDFDIEILDHIIVTQSDTFSMKRAGQI